VSKCPGSASSRPAWRGGVHDVRAVPVRTSTRNCGRRGHPRGSRRGRTRQGSEESCRQPQRRPLSQLNDRRQATLHARAVGPASGRVNAIDSASRDARSSSSSSHQPRRPRSDATMPVTTASPSTPPPSTRLRPTAQSPGVPVSFSAEITEKVDQSLSRTTARLHFSYIAHRHHRTPRGTSLIH